MMTSVSVMPMRLARSTTLRTIAWECITPLGKPVVPEVYMRNAVASGDTARARRDDERGRVRLAEHVGDVLGAEAGVHRDENGADLDHRIRCLDELGAI